MNPIEPSSNAASGAEPVTHGGGLSGVLGRLIPRFVIRRIDQAGEAGKLIGHASIALAFVLAVAAAIFDTGIGLERQFQQWRNSALEHPASGTVALVEIDARSLEAYSQWPWPRSLHGQVVAELDRLGAKEVAFDVDFSAESVADEDRAFAAAIEASSIPVILPTFRQAASQGDDTFVENLPLAELRESALLASVNIMPDRDGFVRSNPYGVVTANTPRPSLAGMLAGSSGSIDDHFPIDLSIDPASIPRVSFSDVVEGTVPRSEIEGKSLLIGATAVEMGDRYAVPGHGVLPGAVIQLMAAETLIKDSAPTQYGAALPLILAFIAIWLIGRSKRFGLAGYGVAALVLLLLPLASEALRIGTFAIIPGLIALAVVAAGRGTQEVLARLRESRLIDAATKLPNSRALLLSARKSPGRAIEVMDIRNHNDVVSALGQQRAGALMRRASERLSMLADGSVYCVGPATLGWLSPSKGGENLDAAAALFNKPIEVDGRSILLIPSFGVSPEDADASIALDHALVAAKNASSAGQRWQRYSDERSREVDDRLSLAAEVDRAIALGDIWVAYQPKLDIAAGKVASAEALVRWTHPERGSVRPDALVSIVEESGKVEEFTFFVLREALRQQREWLEGGVFINVAVNISANLPKNPSFVQEVASIMDVWANPGCKVTFEVTESAAITDSVETIEGLEKLAALGITISIDDYGTGQSTLSYLQRLPASEIKIDKTFVTDLEENASNRTMVQSTIKLAHDLGCKVVAEGIETEAVLSLLAEAGCDFAQGYLIGRPMSGTDFFDAFRSGDPEALRDDKAA